MNPLNDEEHVEELLTKEEIEILEKTEMEFQEKKKKEKKKRKHNNCENAQKFELKIYKVISGALNY